MFILGGIITPHVYAGATYGGIEKGTGYQH